MVHTVVQQLQGFLFSVIKRTLYKLYRTRRFAVVTNAEVQQLQIFFRPQVYGPRMHLHRKSMKIHIEYAIKSGVLNRQHTGGSKIPGKCLQQYRVYIQGCMMHNSTSLSSTNKMLMPGGLLIRKVVGCHHGAILKMLRHRHFWMRTITAATGRV